MHQQDEAEQGWDPWTFGMGCFPLSIPILIAIGVYMFVRLAFRGSKF